VLSDPSKRRELDAALAMWGSGARSHAGFGSYASYYADDSDEESSFPSFFGGVFGRRGSAHAGYGGAHAGYGGGGTGYPGYGGAYSATYGTYGYGAGRSSSARNRNWGF
jgi:DnaJ-class molecular chaperone